MCFNPILIRNPSYGRLHTYIDKRLSNGKHVRIPFMPTQYDYFHDCSSMYIQVPCGRCSQCLQAKQNSFIQRCQMELLGSHLFYITLTYNTESLPFLTTSKGETFFYPDSDDVVKMFKRIRFYDKVGRPFRYAAFSEYGGLKHRPHWHIMLFVDKYDTDTYTDIINMEHKLWYLFFEEWKRNYGTDKFPIWKPLFTYRCRGKKRNYDCHYVNPKTTDKGESDVAFYVSKYLTKFDKWLSFRLMKLNENYNNGMDAKHNEYYQIRNKIRSKCLLSKHFGLTSEKAINHVRKGIEFAIKHCLPSPIFINPVDGRHFPLGRYLKVRTMTLDDAIEFYWNFSNPFNSQDTITPVFTASDYHNQRFKVDKWTHIQKQISERNEDIYDFL